MADRNTVVLIGDLERYHEEAPAYGSTQIKPGYLLEVYNDSGTKKFRSHTVRGGRSQKLFAKEDAFRGGTVAGLIAGIEGTAVSYYLGTNNDQVFAHRAQPGDKIQAVLKKGENVSIGDWAISYGDGTLCKAASAYLADNTAASNLITNTTTETTFSNGTVTIPKNTLAAGDVIRVRAQGIAPATNSTDTLTIKLKIGSTVIATTGAIDVANNDIFVVDASIVIRTVGATGTLVAYGTVSLGASGTATAKVFNLASTTVDTTADQTLTVTATWSVANAGNTVQMDNLLVEKVSGGSGATGSTQGDLVGQFDEAKDLSVAAADAFCKVKIV